VTGPLVSIFMFCRDRHDTVGRAIDSVLAQTYPHVEIVVQDGASTDGTLEILRAYGDRVKLISEPDSGPGEACLRVLRRCTGALMGSCLSDETLVPDAVERAVRAFEADPRRDAVTGDGNQIDHAGRLLGTHVGSPFDVVRYLAGEHFPYFVSSFFRRRTLEEVGIMADADDLDGLEFKIWVRLGLHGEIAYVPGVFGNYALHDGQLSNTPRSIMTNMAVRSRILEGLFRPGAPFAGPGEDFASLRLALLIRNYVCFYNHAVMIGLRDVAEQAFRRMHALGRELVSHLMTRPDGTAALDPTITARGLLGARIPVTDPDPGTVRPTRVALPPIERALFGVVARTFEARGRPAQARTCRLQGGLSSD
jgi:glycosyltransferase involved in cell wall biosynthesis